MVQEARQTKLSVRSREWNPNEGKPNNWSEEKKRESDRPAEIG